MNTRLIFRTLSVQQCRSQQGLFYWLFELGLWIDRPCRCGLRDYVLRVEN